MTVINPKSISGITSITLPSGGDNVLTIHTNDGVERFRVDSSGNVKVGSAATISPDGDVFFTGVCTATTLAGDGSGLTGVASTDNIRTNTNATFLQNVNVSGSTTTGTTIVGGGVTISESGIEASGIGITCANINGGQIGGRRNKVINGAMTVSQKNGTTAVQLSATEQYIVDRFTNDSASSFDMKADASQSTVSPDGFSNSLKLACDGVSTPSSTQNGCISSWLEGQDLQDLAFGTSNAKPLTLSFYAKSASQNNGHVYGVFLGAYLNGTRNAQTRGFTITSSWQRFIMTFDGTGTVTSTAINNDNDKGMQISFSLAAGSDDQKNYATWTADSGLRGFSGQDNFFDNTSNEIYITGVQLEVGSQATAFEHRSFGEELALCQRYYYRAHVGGDGLERPIGLGIYETDSLVTTTLRFHDMRANPTLVADSGSDKFIIRRQSGSDGFNTFTLRYSRVNTAEIVGSGTMSGTAGVAGLLRSAGSGVAFIDFNAEL